MRHFNIPLDLPHAGTVAWRIETLLSSSGASGPEVDDLLKICRGLRTLLEPFRSDGENPGTDEECAEIVQIAAELARQVVTRIAKQGLGTDRIGQCVRNLFECLELGEEGARLSLEAGENPRSALRP